MTFQEYVPEPPALQRNTVNIQRITTRPANGFGGIGAHGIVIG